jgi:undecaprenyl-diphosphatase
MEMYKVIILAIEQGITELLPISSSAHLILTGQLVQLPTDTYLLAVLHLGTTLAILIYFLPILLKDIFHKDSLSFYAKILVATIPAAVAGLLLESVIENILRGNIYIAASLIFWGIAMILVERKYKDISENHLKKISWKQSLIMGFSQVLALIPGTSRSGVTTIAGTLAGVNKYSALQYSFLLGIPILLGTSLYGLLKYAPQEGFGTTHIVSIVVSAIFGYLALQLLNRIKKRNWLTFFGYYRIILGIIILGILFLNPAGL